MPVRALFQLLFAVVVLNSGPDRASAQAVAPVREISIGSIDEAASALTHVMHAALVSDSLLALSQPFEHHVKIFDWHGRPRAVLGRRGSGPGEFANLVRVAPLGSTGLLWVHDAAHQRISVFDAAGSLVRELSVHPLGLAAYLVLLPGDTLVAMRSNGASGIELLVADGTTSRRISTLARYAQQSSGIRIVYPGGRITMTAPFADFPLVAGSPRDGRTFLVDRRLAGSARTDSFSITVFRLNGTRVRRSFAYRPIRVDANDIDRAVDELLRSSFSRGGFVTRASREVVRKAIRDSLKAPAFFSPVSDALIAADGRIWLRREAADTLVRWQVISPDLRRIEQSFDLPIAATARAVQGDRIWTLEHDEFGVPYVVRYRIPGLTTLGG